MDWIALLLVQTSHVFIFDMPPTINKMNCVTAFVIRVYLRVLDFARRRHASRVVGAFKAAFTYFAKRRAFPATLSTALASGLSRKFGTWLIPRATKILLESKGYAPSGKDSHEPVRLSWSIVVKAPVSTSERGLLVVSFESELAKLLRHPRFADIQRKYGFVFLPSWQPAYSVELLELAARATAPFYVLPSSAEDCLRLPAELGANCVTIPLQASNWVSETEFSEDLQRDIDILMLANFASYKRHWKLFEAIGEMRSQCNVVCAGRPVADGTKRTLEVQASAFGVRDRVTIIQGPSNDEVGRLLRRAKLFCAMSYKEGSFVAVAEALVAGAPVAMFEDASIGTKSLITAETGYLLSSRRPLGEQLDTILRNCDGLDPRKFAISNFTAEKSIRVLNQRLKEHAACMGAQWTVDAEGFFSRNFAFGYLSGSGNARLAASYQELASDFDLVFSLLPSKGAD